MTRVFYASTLFGAMTLAAAIDEGMFGERIERRLLVVADNAVIPEVSTRFDTGAAAQSVLSRFDDVASWNDLIAPLHPSDWKPRAEDLPLLGRLVRAQLGLDDAVTELVVESIAVAPARTIALLVPDCPITVFSDGLMSYGPTRDALPEEIATRVERLLHLDLVPDLEPLLLRETGAALRTIPDDAFAKVLGELPVPPQADHPSGAPVIVGQYLSALGVLTRAEEAKLHAAMLTALVAAGHRQVVFKPHPGAGRGDVRGLRSAASRLGVELMVAPATVPAEVWFAASAPELVVSCFSTALLTAARYSATRVATMGCELVLDRLEPYQNSNRIPATIVDATVPALHADGTVTDPPERDVTGLVRAVGFCMQAARNPDLREGAEAYVSTYGPVRYFSMRRLRAIGLAARPAYQDTTAYHALRTAKRVVRETRRR